MAMFVENIPITRTSEPSDAFLLHVDEKRSMPREMYCSLCLSGPAELLVMLKISVQPNMVAAFR